jgi:hypothetical protein
LFIPWCYLILLAQVESLPFPLGMSSGKLEWCTVGLPARTQNPAFLTWILLAGLSGASSWNAAIFAFGRHRKLPVAAENAEAPGLIKVVINVHIQPFHLQRLSSH